MRTNKQSALTERAFNANCCCRWTKSGIKMQRISTQLWLTKTVRWAKTRLGSLKQPRQDIQFTSVCTEPRPTHGKPCPETSRAKTRVSRDALHHGQRIINKDGRSVW